MGVTIAFVGLGPLAQSAALALGARSREITLVGWDADIDLRVAADRLKVFTPVCKRLPEALRAANLVVLGVPAGLLDETLRLLALELRRDVPVLALCSAHTRAHALAHKGPGSRSPFISLYPAQGAAGLDAGAEPRVDAFEKGIVFIADSAGTPPVMLDLAVDFAILQGGQPVFVGADELDGLLAANLLLPRAAVAVLMQTIAAQPSWREGERLAGSELMAATALLEGMDVSAVEAGGANLARLLEELARRLLALRSALSDDDSTKADALLASAADAHAEWLADRRHAAKPEGLASSLPTLQEALKRVLALGG